MSLVRLSTKVVSLDLAPFNEKVENRWYKVYRHGLATLRMQLQLVRSSKN